METLQKKKRGRPKGSTKINKNKPPESNHPLQRNEVQVINSKASIEDNRNRIQEWLNGPQDFAEGINLLQKTTKKYQLWARLRKRESETNRFKIAHELERYLNRTEPAISKKELASGQKNETAGSIAEKEDIAAMENLTISEKIQKWLTGSKDYQRGRDLLKIVPGEKLHYLQLTHIETYESQVKLGIWLKNALNYLENY